MHSNPFADNDILSFLQGFATRETKEDITNKYIKGIYTKEQFIKKMEKFDKIDK
jgi:hypothetical protein